MSGETRNLSPIKFKCGQKIGKWEILGLDKERSGKGFGTYYLAQCECGRIGSVRARALTTRNDRSCLFCCKPDTLIGKRFGKWRVMSLELERRNNDRYYLCQCDCGYKKKIQGQSLREGKSTRCLKCRYKAIKQCGKCANFLDRELKCSRCEIVRGKDE